MSKTNRRPRAVLLGVTAIALVILALVVAGASLLVERTVTSPTTATPSPTPTPSPTLSAISRGESVATVPAWVEDDPRGLLACRYVIALTAADSRLDVSEFDSWRRTKPYSTPDFYQLNASAKTPRGDSSWIQMKNSDGWIEPVIDNVLSGKPQAPSTAAPTSERSATGAGQTVTVIYHRKLHIGPTTVTDVAVHQAVVHLTNGVPPLVDGVTLS